MTALFLFGFSLGRMEVDAGQLSVSFNRAVSDVMDPEEAVSYIKQYVPQLDTERILESVDTIAQLVEKILD